MGVGLTRQGSEEQLEGRLPASCAANTCLPLRIRVRKQQPQPTHPVPSPPELAGPGEGGLWADGAPSCPAPPPLQRHARLALACPGRQAGQCLHTQLP